MNPRVSRSLGLLSADQTRAGKRNGAAEVRTVADCTKLRRVSRFVVMWTLSRFLVQGARAECPGEGLKIAHCSLLIAHCSLLIAHCSLFIAHCSLRNGIP